jgi:DNA-binding PadR family transcriptional regulator
MATITNSEVALLLLLCEGPAHPYQIEKLIHDRSMNEWTELSRSTIYKTLVKLEAKGFATSDASLTEKNVGRKTYAITEEGGAVLRTTLLGFLSEPEKAIWRLDLVTSHLGLLDPAEADAAMARYTIELTNSIECYGRLEEYLVASGCPAHALALARRPAALYRAELAWLEEYRRDLASSRCAASGDGR